jgi:vitamin K-dependent gamma-carboxylase
MEKVISNNEKVFRLAGLTSLLHQANDNTALIIFRVAFGWIIFIEAIGGILIGWTGRILVAPSFHFTFIGFDFLQALQGEVFYLIYLLMALSGVGIAIGYYYRMSAILYFLTFAATYFAHKVSYNNHHYLMLLLSVFMIIVPANAWYSNDVRCQRVTPATYCKKWHLLLFLVQGSLLYVYAAVAKLNADWLSLQSSRLVVANRTDWPVLGSFLQQDLGTAFIAYGGIAFDALIVPAMLWYKTRPIAFIALIAFHASNALLFPIGIFPLLAISLSVFFFPAKTLKKLFFRKKPDFIPAKSRINPTNRWITAGLIIYFFIQIFLPLRHHLFPGKVAWTEEGHRLSWRMMLRKKRSISRFTAVNKQTGETWDVSLNKHLTPRQQQQVGNQPDLIWQFARYVSEEYKLKTGGDIAVYADVKVSLNGKPYQQFIDPKTDLASVEWNRFKTASWIIPFREPPVSGKE